MSAVLACGSGSLSGGVYRGIASEAHLVCVKVLNTRTGHISEKDIARGIQWVIDNQVRYNIRILNIAVGADKPQSLAESAIDKLVEQAVAAGVMVVVAGGNSPGSAILPPASAPSALTVGGYDDHSNLATGDWSMYHSTSGETLDGISKPDILGPATELPGPLLPGTDQAADAKALFSLLDSEDHSVHGVYELVRQDLMEKPKKGARLHSWARKRLAAAKYVTRNHKKMEGTSVAAGIVTSVAAQVLEVHPGLLPSAVRSILLTSAVPMKGVPDEIQGAGRLNARAAVRLALARRETGEEKDVLLVPRYVSLQYRDKAAQQVSITGEFNNWNPDAHPCHEVEEGVWSCLFPEPEPGKERYKLVVDGTRWVEDPAAPSREPDGFGGWNSRFHPGKKAE